MRSVSMEREHGNAEDRFAIAVREHSDTKADEDVNQRQTYLQFDTYLVISSLVPRPFLVGGRKQGGKGRRKGLVNKSTPTRIHRISIIDSSEATNTYKFITHTLNVKPHVHTTHSFIYADGWNADSRQGRVIHQTLPSLSAFAPPTRKGLGTKLDDIFIYRR